MLRKSTVGYIKSMNGSRVSLEVQEHMIRAYCDSSQLGQIRIYKDVCYRSAEKRHSNDGLADNPMLWPSLNSAWEEMLIDAVKGKIGTILTDTKSRLYSNSWEKKMIEKVMACTGIKILEVGMFPPAGECAVVSIYHYTESCGMKAGLVTRDIDTLYQESAKYGQPAAIYLDTAGDKKRNLRSLLNRPHVDTVVCQRFYNIHRRLPSFIDTAFAFADRQVSLISIKEGSLIAEPADKVGITAEQLSAVLYDCREMTDSTGSDLYIKKAELFVKECTSGWQINEMYRDVKPRVNFSKRPELKKMLKSACKFDVLLVGSFNKLGIYTSDLISVLKMGFPVYSIDKGVIRLE